MRQPQLTENEALNGMMRLSNLTRIPIKITQKELSEKSGLPMAKISVLKQNDILSCQPDNDGSKGRKFKWVWEGPLPNIPMARKLVTAIPDYPTKRKDPPQDQDKHETPSREAPATAPMRSKVEVFRNFEITKSVNGSSAFIRVEENGDNKPTVFLDLHDEEALSVDEMKCWGYAFLTAADELSRE